jgi:hypothetical protein
MEPNRTGPETLGLTKLGTARCPRTLIPRRGCKGPVCWCSGSLNDHAGTYRTAQGGKVILWQPYEASPHALAPVFNGAEADGLSVYLSGQAPWSPGQCLAIFFAVAESNGSNAQ